LLLAFVALLPAPVAAQSADAEARGRVTDGSGAGLGGVRIVAQSPSLPGRAETTTSSSGDYVLRALPAGDYVLTFQKAGFVDVKHTTRLSVRERAAIDARLARLPDAARPEPVVAVTEGPPMQLRGPLDAATFRAPDFLDLPLAGTLLSFGVIAPGLLALPLPEIAWNGAPVRFRHADGAAAVRPGRDALWDVTFLTAGQPPDIAAPTLAAFTTRTGLDRLHGSVQLTGGTAGESGDELRHAGARATDVTFGATIGGSLWPRRIWLFAAGDGARDHFETPAVAAAADEEIDSRTTDYRGLGTLTFAWARNQRLALNAARSRRSTSANVFDGFLRATDATSSADLESRHGLESATLVSGLGQRALIEITATHESTTASQSAPRGAAFGDRTALVDPWLGYVWSAPRGCSGCGDDRRRARTARAVYRHVAAGGAGAHEITIGAEAGDDRRASWREPGNRFEVLVSRTRIVDGVATAVMVPNGSSALVWYPPGDAGVRARSAAVFAGDQWRVGRGLTLEAGARWERVRIHDATGVQFYEEDAVSPRLALAWAPAEIRDLRLSAGYARYATPFLASELAHLAPAARVFPYTGPPLNTGNGAVLPSTAVLDAVEDWFSKTAGAQPSSIFAVGLPTVAASGRAPRVTEWSAGVARQYHLFDLRVHVVRREVEGVRLPEFVPGQAVEGNDGVAADATRLTVRDGFGSRATAVTLQGTYQLGLKGAAGASYTYTSTGGDLLVPGDHWPTSAYGYRQYLPEHSTLGDVTGEPRTHKINAYFIYELMNSARGLLTASGLVRLDSSATVGIGGWIAAPASIVNPGYVTPPAAVPYAFVDDDAFRKRRQMRVDLSVRFARPFAMRSEWFVRLDALNLLGRRREITAERSARAITAFQDPGRFLPFDPATTSPERGVHWDLVELPAEARFLSFGASFRWIAGVRF
jgi:hypothetical protein